MERNDSFLQLQLFRDHFKIIHQSLVYLLQVGEFLFLHFYVVQLILFPLPYSRLILLFNGIVHLSHFLDQFL